MKHTKIFILFHKISYKTLTGPKPLRIRLDKIDEFIRVQIVSRKFSVI